MNSKTLSIDSPDFLQPAAAKPRGLDRLARRMVLDKLRHLHHGEITLVEAGGSQTFGRADASFPLAVTLTVNSPAFFSDVAFGGSVGAGESYIHGCWECSDLVALVRILLRNRDVLDSVEGGAARLTQPLRKAFHWLNRNTRKGSRQVNRHHIRLRIIDPTTAAKLFHLRRNIF